MTFDLLKMIADGMGFVLTKCPENEADYNFGYWICGPNSFYSDGEFEQHYDTLKNIAEFLTNEVCVRKNKHKEALQSIEILKELCLSKG